MRTCLYFGGGIKCGDTSDQGDSTSDHRAARRRRLQTDEGNGQRRKRWRLGQEELPHRISAKKKRRAIGKDPPDRITFPLPFPIKITLHN
jgi:hypothetical protein